MSSRAFVSGLSRRSATPVVTAVILVLAAFVALTWANYRFSLENPGGNDFIPRWVGLRLFLTQGLSPYGDETSHTIQQIIFGRPAEAGEDHSLFVYPLYTLVLMWPYALVSSLPLARAMWMASLQLLVLWLAAGSLHLIRWRPKPVLFGALFVFVALWYHTVRPIINGNPGILVAALILAALLAIRERRESWAGLFLALATIKLHVVLLLAPLVMLWAYSRGRRGLAVAPAAWTLLLIAGTTLMLPDWTLQNLAQIRAYPEYTLPGSPGAIFVSWWPEMGSTLGWLLTAVMVIILAREWRAVWGQPFDHFLWTASLTLAATTLIGIRTATENYIAFFPALVLIWACWEKQRGSYSRFLAPATMAFLFAGLWVLFLATLEAGATQHLIMFLPLPLFTVIGLYSVRAQALSTSPVQSAGSG
jgi:hypothetical protein